MGTLSLERKTALNSATLRRANTVTRLVLTRMAVFILEDALSVQTDNASLVICV